MMVGLSGRRNGRMLSRFRGCRGQCIASYQLGLALRPPPACRRL